MSVEFGKVLRPSVKELLLEQREQFKEFFNRFDKKFKNNVKYSSVTDFQNKIEKTFTDASATLSESIPREPVQVVAEAEKISSLRLLNCWSGNLVG